MGRRIFKYPAAITSIFFYYTLCTNRRPKGPMADAENSEISSISLEPITSAEKGVLHKRQLRLGVVIFERVLIFEEI